MNTLKPFAAFLCLSLLLTGCSSSKKNILPPEKPVEELYLTASNFMDKDEYHKAADAFEEVERQHPYSGWSTRAQIMSAYALYKAMDYSGAISAIDQFLQLHPGNKKAAYAYYLRGLCFYEQIADVRRDQTAAKAARNSMERLISLYPKSVYARDALLKISLIDDHLAGSEMEVGRNYMKTHLYTAALSRFRNVVENYQTTSHVPEALHRLVECYIILGIPSEAQATASVLGHNFPGSRWYQDSYALLSDSNLTPEEDKTSWIGRIWREVF